MVARSRRIVRTALLAGALGAFLLPGHALAGIRAVHGLAYRVVGGTTLRMDVWRPAGRAAARPALLLHGGSWRSGGRQLMAPQGEVAAGWHGR